MKVEVREHFALQSTEAVESVSMDQSSGAQQAVAPMDTEEPSSVEQNGDGQVRVVQALGKRRSKREYNLRDSSLINRIQTERRRTLPKQPKPKAKPPPLSKYRRKTANARERGRMTEINEAFENLRQVIPSQCFDNEPHNIKLTKITTLRLAMNYIEALRDMLGYDDDFCLEIASTSNSTSDLSCSSPGSSSSTDEIQLPFPLLNESGSDEQISPSHGLLDSEGESITS